MRKYINPLPVATDKLDPDTEKLGVSPYHPDPYVMKWNGRYYAYATAGEGVSVMTSPDMTEWTHRGYAYREEGRHGYWAPAVIYVNGLFYLYVSNMPVGEDDAHLQFMRVAVSDSPTGPFEYRKTLFDTFSIDAHVVRDTDGGLVLFYSTNETYGIDAHRAGTVIIADRLLDPLTPEGKPKLIVRPTLDEEVFAENRFGDGRDWHTIEGAFHLKRGGKHYVMYSGNAFTSPYYYVGFSMADHSADKSLTELDWTKYPDDDSYEPLLRQNEKVEGVGHNSVAKAPNNIDDWIVYHGREVREQGPEEGERRQMRMDPIRWHGEQMTVSGPTYEAKSAPAMPSFRDLFDRTDTADGAAIGEGWATVGGDWRISGEALLQSGLVGIGRAYLGSFAQHAVCEINVRWERSHMGGLYGAILESGDGTFVEVMFDVGKGTIGIYETILGLKLETVSAAVPQGFKFDVYHQLLVRAAGNRIAVELDGSAILDGTTYAPFRRYGLTTHYTSASFAGISLTESLSFLASGAAACMAHADFHTESGDWHADGAALIGMPMQGAASLQLHNPFASATSCRFEAEGNTIALQFTLSKRDGDGSRAISISLAGSTTLHIVHDARDLQIWTGDTLALSEPTDERLESLTLSSSRKLTLRNLEWTALGT
ncbi:glycoside hydrolase family 43 protein [Paenibacillus sp. strain BS8-2]